MMINWFTDLLTDCTTLPRRSHYWLNYEKCNAGLHHTDLDSADDIEPLAENIADTQSLVTPIDSAVELLNRFRLRVKPCEEVVSNIAPLGVWSSVGGHRLGRKGSTTSSKANVFPVSPGMLFEPEARTRTIWCKTYKLWTLLSPSQFAESWQMNPGVNGGVSTTHTLFHFKTPLRRLEGHAHVRNETQSKSCSDGKGAKTAIVRWQCKTQL